MKNDTQQFNTLWLAFTTNLIAAMWHAWQVLQFGFSFDQIDMIGVYFLVNLATLLYFNKNQRQVLQGDFWFAAWSFINVLMLLLFLRQFLSTFDPFYRAGANLYPYLLRFFFLLTGLFTVLTFGFWAYFRFPKRLLTVAGIATIYWLFVYIAPSAVRSFYVTGTTDISGITGTSGDTMRMYSRKNPERGVQSDATLFALFSWLALFFVGYYRQRQSNNGANREQPNVV